MEVTWDQVLAWRLKRQFLEMRGGAGAEEIVGRLCGVQAQVASAAEVALGVRQAEPRSDALRRGLEDRVLVKTWAMRGTLHAVRSSEVASYLSLIASARTWTKPVWQRSFGATPKDVAALVEAVSTILDGAVLTRDELVTALVSDGRFSGMEEQLRSGWGALLKPLAWQGALCYGPSQGTKVTFTRPASLLPDWKGLPDPDEAAPTVIASYLGAYGPATPELFDAWLSRNSLRKTVLRAWFADMGDDLTEVRVEGHSAYMLSEHADDLADCAPSTSVRLLGAFDQYVLGPGTKATEMLPATHRGKVSRAAGWISPVLVDGGRITGVWDLTDGEVVVSLFPDADKPSGKALESEVEHIARVNGTNDLTVRFT